MQMNDNYIWVEKDSYHTAIIVMRSQVESLCSHMAQEVLSKVPNKAVIRFGWGDREYYGASNKNIFLAIKALLLPTRAVMEVASFSTVEEAGDQLIKIGNNVRLNQDVMLQNIFQYFYEDKDSNPMLIRKEKNGCYYFRANGIYFLLWNCNNWTAKMLNKAGLPIHYVHAFLSFLVMRQIK